MAKEIGCLVLLYLLLVSDARFPIRVTHDAEELLVSTPDITIINHSSVAAGVQLFQVAATPSGVSPLVVIWEGSGQIEPFGGTFTFTELEAVHLTAQDIHGNFINSTVTVHNFTGAYILEIVTHDGYFSYEIVANDTITPPPQYLYLHATPNVSNYDSFNWFLMRGANYERYQQNLIPLTICEAWSNPNIILQLNNSVFYAVLNGTYAVGDMVNIHTFQTSNVQARTVFAGQTVVLTGTLPSLSVPEELCSQLNPTSGSECLRFTECGWCGNTSLCLPYASQWMCPSNWTAVPAVCPANCLHGTCNRTDQCTCTAGWSGTWCSEPDCAVGCVNGNCTLPGQCVCFAGWSGPLCSVPLCSPNCVHGNCTGQHTCACESGWQGTACDSPVCTLACVHGECILPNNCSCNSGWTGAQCNQPRCFPPCQNGQCALPNNCSCYSGWTGPLCTVPLCSPNCVHGNCTAPNQCTCAAGWGGLQCDSPVCSQPCVNGVCSTPNNCSCSFGWTGPQCAVPLCSPNCLHGVCASPNTCLCNAGWDGPLCSVANCTPPCANGGNCTQPGTCVCSGDWTGDDCSQPVCSPNCVYGSCVSPNTCRCSPGYTGPWCNVSLCVAKCVHGECTDDGSCKCSRGFRGRLCTDPVCEPPCGMHGRCSAPNSCRCSLGWTGPTCESLMWEVDALIAFGVALACGSAVGVGIVRWRRKRALAERQALLADYAGGKYGSSSSSESSRSLVRSNTSDNKNVAVPEDLEIKFSEIRIVADRIEGGAQGEIAIGYWHSTKVVVKRFFVATASEMDSWVAEVSALKQLHHPCVVQLLGICTDPPAVVTEFVARGSLFALLHTPTTAAKIDAGLRRAMARDIASGMSYVHSRGMLHRDLKSPNLFVNEHWRVKIGDFGSARPLAQTMTARVGSPRWTAPETLQSGHYSEKADVFSFGIVMWELCEKKTPFCDIRFNIEVERKILLGERPTLSPEVEATVEAAYLELMRECWSQEPEQRPSFEVVVARLEELQATFGELHDKSAQTTATAASSPMPATPVAAASWRQLPTDINNGEASV